MTMDDMLINLIDQRINARDRVNQNMIEDLSKMLMQHTEGHTENIERIAHTHARRMAAGLMNDHEYQKHSYRPIDEPMDRRGYPWSDTEDGLLRREIGEAIEKIADAHGRTANAIRCRVRDINIFKF